MVKEGGIDNPRRKSSQVSKVIGWLSSVPSCQHTGAEGAIKCLEPFKQGGVA